MSFFFLKILRQTGTCNQSGSLHWNIKALELIITVFFKKITAKMYFKMHVNIYLGLFTCITAIYCCVRHNISKWKSIRSNDQRSVHTSNLWIFSDNVCGAITGNDTGWQQNFTSLPSKCKCRLWKFILIHMIYACHS